MKEVHLALWAVVHVSPRGRGKGGPKANRIYLAVAETGSKATSKVHLATQLPYEEFYTQLVRRDPVPVPAKDWNPALEYCVGCVEDFWPRTCPTCKGRGSVKEWSTCHDYEWKTCSLCKGTGAKPRRPRSPPAG